MKLIFILLLFTASMSAQGQNLVPNPSFEDTIACPDDFNQVTSACKDWRAYTFGSPDYYNKCGTWPMSLPLSFSGFQQPVDGNAYIGFLTVSAPSFNWK